MAVGHSDPWGEAHVRHQHMWDKDAIGSSVTALPGVVNSHYTVTVKSLCSDCA